MRLRFPEHNEVNIKGRLEMLADPWEVEIQSCIKTGNVVESG